MTTNVTNVHIDPLDDPVVDASIKQGNDGNVYAVIELGGTTDYQAPLVLFVQERHFATLAEALGRVRDVLRAHTQLDALAPQPEPGALDVAEVGDVLPLEDGPVCLAPVKRIGDPCTRRRYHAGQHVAQDPKGRVLAVRPVTAEAIAS